MHKVDKNLVEYVTRMCPVGAGGVSFCRRASTIRVEIRCRVFRYGDNCKEMREREKFRSELGLLVDYTIFGT